MAYVSGRALNNVTTQNAYDNARTLFCPGTEVFVMTTTGAAIYWQIGKGTESGIVWNPDEFFRPPSNYVEDEFRFDAIRVRSGLAGTPAQVSIRTSP